MPKKQVTLMFPQQLIKEPVIYRMSKECNVVFNIRRAKITETAGEVTLELEGTDEQLKQGVHFLEAKGIKVQPVTGDVVT